MYYYMHVIAKKVSYIVKLNRGRHLIWTYCLLAAHIYKHTYKHIQIYPYIPTIKLYIFFFKILEPQRT